MKLEIMVAFDWDDTLFFGIDWREVEKEQFMEVLSQGKVPHDEIEILVLDYLRNEASGTPTLERKEWLMEQALACGVPNIKTAQDYYDDYFRRKARIREKMSSVWLSNPPLVSGTKELLSAFSDLKVPVYLVSAGDRNEKIKEAEACGIGHFFAGVYGSGMTDFDPYSKAEALQDIVRINQLDPSQLVYFGDGIKDVEAAKKAGVMAVVLVEDHKVGNELFEAGADLLVCRDWGKIVGLLKQRSRR